MATYLSENLNESEKVSGPARLTGYSLSATGVEHRFVTITGGSKKMMLVVPPGETTAIAGINEPFPEGLSIESKVGDGKCVANIFYEETSSVVFPDLADIEVEDE